MISRQLKKIPIIVASVIILILNSSTSASAIACRDSNLGYSISVSSSVIDKEDNQDLVIHISGLATGVEHKVVAQSVWGSKTFQIPIGQGETNTYELRIPDNQLPTGPYIDLVLTGEGESKKNDCFFAEDIPTSGSPTESSCSITITNSDSEKRNCGDRNSTFVITVSNATDSDGNNIDGGHSITGARNNTLGQIQLTNGNGTLNISGNSLSSGVSSRVTLKGRSSLGTIVDICRSREELVVLANADRCEEHLASSLSPGIFKLCQAAAVENGGENPCTRCYDSEGIWTALGCLPTKPADLLPKLAQFAVGLAGGIALMLMLVGAFRISVSAGNPDNVQAGKDMFTSAVAGLLLIIFSALILRIIGVDIFQLPGF